jgi:hypothetical protein
MCFLFEMTIQANFKAAISIQNLFNAGVDDNEEST